MDERSGNAIVIHATEISKMVEFTLLPHKTKEKQENGGNQVKENNGGEEEELCGSQGKKKRKSTPKTTPQSTSSKKAKGKRVVKLTPKKILHAEEATPSLCPTIPDLRQEANMTREENSRMFAGRKIHPFFSYLKAGKNSQEPTQSAERGCAERKKSETSCHTIHVYERTEDDDVLSPDWQNWTFLENNIVNNGHALQNTCSSAFEGCVKCLSLDDLPIVLPASDEIEEPMDHCSVKKESSTVCNVDQSKEMMLRHLLCSAELDGNLNKTCGSEARPILEHQSRFLQDRMQSYYLRCQSLPENCLWTYKYQPKMAMEVCGNFKSVKFLSEWLYLWHERENNKRFAGRKNFPNQDDNSNCTQSQSDSDFESPDEEDSLKKVLLITGSCGSGKSAAIYACAKEHGFTIFELSSSNVRSGAILKKMFGGATETHQLNCSGNNSKGPRNSSIVKDGEEFECISSDDEEIEDVPLPDDDSKDNIDGGVEFDYNIASESTSSQDEAMALILIEDVDIILPKDRGLISAIREIANKGKRPIILTSNNSDPVLPDKLVGLQVSFTQPSPTELLSHLYMICASEGVNIQPCLLERIIHCYQNDIRKTIMHLQFLCQGKGFRDKIQKKYSPLLFDRDAGHEILPLVMPWSFPSHLSELVDKEIVKLLLRSETAFCSVEASESKLYEEKKENCQQYRNFEDRYLLEVKKAAMMSRNGSIQGHNGLTLEFDAAHERSDILVPNKDDSILSSHHPRSPNYARPLNGLVYHMTANTFEDHYPCSVNAGGIDLNEASMSITTSYVPESIFVPETNIHDMELFSKMASHGDAGPTPNVSMNGLFQNVLSTEANNFDSHTHPTQQTTDVLKISRNAFDSSRCGGEGFSCNGHMENMIRTYALMDEGSCADFNKSKFIEKPELNVSDDSVDELWKQIRLLRFNLLGHHVTPEKQETVQIVELVHRMSHLISDSDLLLSSYQPQDISEMPTFVSEEPDSFFLGIQQLEMSSTIAQHGFCTIVSDIATTASCAGFSSRLDIVTEMLASMTNTNTEALRKLMRYNMMNNSSYTTNDLELSLPRHSHVQESYSKSHLFNVIQHVAPKRLHLALKGVQFFEYISSLRCISRSETLRITKGPDKTKRRRGRVAQHYLRTGSNLFSPEGITLLEQSHLPYKDIQGS